MSDHPRSKLPEGPSDGLLPPPQGFGAAYESYLLENARQRVEEEIAASLFVRGAWRDLFGREPGPPGFETHDVPFRRRSRPSRSKGATEAAHSHFSEPKEPFKKVSA